MEEYKKEYKKFTKEHNEAKDFVKFLDEIFPDRVDENLSDQIKTESETFLVTSTGMVGDTTSTATAVFDFSSSKVGRVKYWRVN